MSRPSILILGAGAIGQWLACLLCAEGSQEVGLVCRPRQADDLRSNGIRFVGGNPRPKIYDVVPNEAISTVVLTVKTFQVAEAVQDLVRSGLRFDRLITIQNGLGSDEIVCKQWPGREIWVATTTTAVAFQDGTLVPATKGGLAIAPATPLAQAVPPWLGRLGPPLQFVKKPDWLKWSKLLLNMTCNASCALLDWGAEQVARHPALFAMELRCLREALGVLEREQNRVVDLLGYPAWQLAMVARLPPVLARPILRERIAKARGDKPPSLLLDLRAGRPHSEVGWMNGAVARRGRELGLDCPVNAALSEALSAVVEGRVPWETYRGNPEAVLGLVSA